MPKFSEKKVVGYTARQLYDLVLDVEKYPEFVPWCKDCEVLERKMGHIIADMMVKFSFFEKSYRSLIKHGIKEEKYFIEVEQISGPFEKLNTSWEFIKVDKLYTDISFTIDFEFKSKIIDNLVSSMFHSAAKEMIKAFERRADIVYDKNKRSS